MKIGTWTWFAMQCCWFMYHIIILIPIRGQKKAICYVRLRWRDAWKYLYNDYDNFMRKR